MIKIMHYCVHILLIIIIVCIVGGVILAFSIFFVGNRMAPDRVQIENVSLTHTHLKLRGILAFDSALAYKNYTYRIVDNKLYIKITSVLVSRWYQSAEVNLDIEGSFENIEMIYLEDNRSEKQIWMRD